MAADLAASLGKIHLTSSGLDGSQDEEIDDLLHQSSPPKRPRRAPDDWMNGLQHEFLRPAPALTGKWLDQVQQRWDSPEDCTQLLGLAPTQTRTIIRFDREGLEGRVTGYREVTVAAASATAKNSTSLLRRPANRANFVRGSAGSFPFAPGGLEGAEAFAALDELDGTPDDGDSGHHRSAPLDKIITLQDTSGLLEVPPGFNRGLNLDADTSAVGKEGVSMIDEALSGVAARPEGSRLSGKDPSDAESHNDPDAKRATDEDDDSDDIDSLLPVEFPALEPRGQLAVSGARRRGREWAHMVDINREMTNFRELVPDMAREWPFELDTFQKEAVYHLENGDSVFVAAHTSAGKTVVAEYAIALAAKHMTKAIYTSPIKALSNQKFRDFRTTFDDVGILTGDVQIRPEASCLIMTTEILRSMLYRGADLIRDVEYVIFDEVHYVNDLERGVVWEEVIIMLPEHVTLILLSATVPNTYEFASWVGRTKKKDIYVISTPKRPVPLEHYLWANKAMHKIVDADKKFIERGWKDANDALSGKDKIKAASNTSTPANVRGGDQRGRGRGQGQRGGGQRGAPQGSRGTVQRGGGGGGGRGGSTRTTAAQDRNIWVHLVQHLKKEHLLPACIFVFSKRRCEENADALSNLDYCTASEKSAIRITMERSLARLKPEDRVLPQIRRLRELCSRGIAVHHGGLLPIVKEVVEILFAKTLVKVLFATETFAMGLNLPTRTVVFSGYRKHDGRSFRDLLPGEYTQMAGRAGRRGLDPVGSVVIVSPGSDEAPPVGTLRNMILGDPTKLRSQFRLTYNMILNLLRVEALKIEEMIKRSFSEHATQTLLPQHEKQVKVSEADLAKIKREPCDICDIDLEDCHQASMDFIRLTSELHLASLSSPVGKRSFSQRRLLVFSEDGIRKGGILAKDGVSGGLNPMLQIISFESSSASKDPSHLLPFLPRFRRLFGDIATNTLKFNHVRIPLENIECVTKTVLKVDLSTLLQNDASSDRALIGALCSSWESSEWDELDWLKIRDMHIRNTLDERQRKIEMAEARRCLECPDFIKHFSMRHDEWVIKENISELRQLMSDQNLQLLPDYEQRIAVLKDLDFIDDNSRVQLKGKVACEIHSADELVLTELILDNVLAEFEPEEIVALLSAFVFQEKTDNTPTLTASLEKVRAGAVADHNGALMRQGQGRDTIIAISEKVNAFQTQHQVILSSDDSNDFVSRPRFGLVEVVYEWARGMSFNRITDLTDVLEGTIVRVISRLDETCREVKNAARIIGDPTLFTKMQQCQEMIKRDITAVASL
ncbi:MAG: hypothetical protein M1817_002846 [Caeruleum heppii]|nr:MAG: hypothetical protein M1817_002846 [Caeruleum heppii]